MSRTDVLLVGLGSTAGLRAAEDELAASLRRAGARVEMVRARPPRTVRTLVLTDLLWALAARAAARRGIAEHAPRALVYSTTTAALLWPRSGDVRRAIRYDAPAAANRRGRHGLWQRPLERRRLRQADLLVPQTGVTLAETPTPHADAVVVPIPVEPTAGVAAGVPRGVTAVTYAANWRKKGLDRILAAWALARSDGEVLLVVGVTDEQIRAAARAAGLDGIPAGVDHHELLEPEVYRERLRLASVYVTAPRREDFGVAQLEALADGCALVTTDPGGPYAALPLARAIDPRWVVADDADPATLAAAIRAAVDDPPVGLAARTLEAVAPYRRAAVDAVVAREVLPRLLPA
ncbi:glycosyltransferase [Paraconexibacter sp.]|uniref:glycosyltransferase n=1 Tax=Paraconexibacter sp. TaxID=2949640 RepID=UPI0035634433